MQQSYQKSHPMWWKNRTSTKPTPNPKSKLKTFMLKCQQNYSSSIAILLSVIPIDFAKKDLTSPEIHFSRIPSICSTTPSLRLSLIPLLLQNCSSETALSRTFLNRNCVPLSDTTQGRLTAFLWTALFCGPMRSLACFFLSASWG